MRIQKGHDLNLTRILLSLISCERVVEVEWFNRNRSRFAYCSSCQNCTTTSSNDGNHLVPVFWNRLQVTRGSLLLNGIQDNDDGRTIRVVVFMKASGKPNGKDVGADMISVNLYTIGIFVNHPGN